MTEAPETAGMAEMDVELRDELVELGKELFEGDITQQGYDKRLIKLLSKHNAVPGEAYVGSPGTGDTEAVHNFPPTTTNSGLKSEAQDNHQHSTAGVGDTIIAFEEPSYPLPFSDHPGPAESIAVTEVEKPPTALLLALRRTEAFVKEWTPFTLVASYFVFSTCLYMLCDGELISIFWFIYLITNFYIAGSTVSLPPQHVLPNG